MGFFSTPRFTNWIITGNAGGTAQLETPVVNLSAGVGYLWLPLRNSATGQTMSIHAVGGGVGLGVGQSVLGPVDIEGSLPQFPSSGIGTLLAGLTAPSTITPSDLRGCTVYALSLGAKCAGGGSVTAVFFLSTSWAVRGATALVPGLADDLLAAQAGGLFAGVIAGAGASAGATLYQYLVVSA